MKKFAAKIIAPVLFAVINSTGCSVSFVVLEKEQRDRLISHPFEKIA